MKLESDSIKGVPRVKVQRTRSGHDLGACLALSAADLTFVNAGTDWLTIEKKPIKGGLIVEIRGSER